ncbi:MAG: transcriptional repressor [Bacteroidota bacterium]|nr:transcriptional repressor [Bacteroidota bacterium]
MAREKTKTTFRHSQQRERILEILRTTDRHPTADWVYGKLKKEFPKLSLGTIYRNLSMLVVQGQVKKIHSGSTFDRYEANITQHYHLICEKCKKITDIELTIYNEINERVNKLTDFKINHHKVEFFGICSKCNKDNGE